MENGKKLIVLLLVLLLGCGFVGVAFADVDLYVYNPISAGAYVDTRVHFDAANDTVGMHFVGNGRYLYGVAIFLKNDSVEETGVMQACLWNTSGALGAYTVLTAALGYSAPVPVVAKLVGLFA